MTSTITWPTVRFRPRRLGHVNLFVSDLEASFAFYHLVCGLTLAFDEKELFARFLSNGNSHHDVAIMEATGKTLVGRDGQVQISPERGAAAGLNHLAFEIATEAALVEGIHRAEAAGFPPDKCYDHLISRSAYLRGPDGVEVEVYADSTKDWRGLYARLDSGLMSARWLPGSDGPPSDVPYYTEEMDHRPAAGGLAQPLRTARAGLVVSDLGAGVAYFDHVVGLTTLEADWDDGRWAIMSGQLGLPDLLVLERMGDEPLGYHHAGLELAGLDELEGTVERLQGAGVPIERRIAHARKRSVVLRDPDGMAVELFAAVPGVDPAVTYRSLATADNREWLA